MMKAVGVEGTLGPSCYWSSVEYVGLGRDLVMPNMHLNSEGIPQGVSGSE